MQNSCDPFGKRSRSGRLGCLDVPGFAYCSKLFGNNQIVRIGLNSNEKRPDRAFRSLQVAVLVCLRSAAEFSSAEEHQSTEARHDQ